MVAMLNDDGGVLMGAAEGTASWFSGLTLDAALRVVREGLQVVNRRLSGPDAAAEFARFTAATPQGSGLDVGNTVPGLLRTTQTVLHLASGVQARLDGFTAESFSCPNDRAALLGLPAHGKIGFRNPGEFLQDATSVSPRAAQQRVRDAEDFRPHCGGAVRGDAGDDEPDATGRLAALLPEVAAGFADCTIAADRLRLITAAVAKIRSEQGDTDDEIVQGLIRGGDAELAEAARNDTYPEFRAAVARWRQAVLMALHPDGAETIGEQEAYRRRGLRFIRQDGELFIWESALTQEGHELFRTVEAAANNPRRRDEGFCDGENDGENPGEKTDGTNGVGGANEPVTTDERTRTQRAHDGLLGVLGAGLRDLDNDLPSQGGARPQLTVTAGLAALMQVAHRSGLLPGDVDPALWEGASSQDLLISAGYSGPAGASMLRRMLCNADITPMVLGTEGEVLDVGKSNRLFSAVQRKALVARDGGCAVPGCTFPAAWCEAHHVVPWSRGGPTTIDNGVLLCTHHHHAVHEDHWTVEMTDGVPWLTRAPGPLLTEAERAPRRNRVWRSPSRRAPGPSSTLPSIPPPPISGIEQGSELGEPPGGHSCSELRHRQLVIRQAAPAPRRQPAPAATRAPSIRAGTTITPRAGRPPVRQRGRQSGRTSGGTATPAESAEPG